MINFVSLHFISLERVALKSFEIGAEQALLYVRIFTFCLWCIHELRDDNLVGY